MLTKKNHLILKTFLSLFFLISGLGKLMDPNPSIVFISFFFNSPYSTPTFWHFLLVYSTAIVELILLTLLWTRFMGIASTYLLIMVVFFSLIILSFPLRNIELSECGCFGSILPNGSLFLSLFRNIFLLIIIYVIKKGKYV